MRKPVFSQFNLVVNDMERSVAFYRRLGLEIADVAEPRSAWAAHHRDAEGGDARLELDSATFTRHYDAGFNGRGGILGFSLERREDVDELHASLVAAGYTSEQEPYDAFWGARYAVVEDPDGNPVGLMSPIDPSLKSDPGFDPSSEADSESEGWLQ